MPLAAILFLMAILGSLLGIFSPIPNEELGVLVLSLALLAIIIRHRFVTPFLISLGVLCASAYLGFEHKKNYYAQIAELPEGRTIFHGQLEELSRDLDGDQTGILAIDSPFPFRLFISFKNGAAALPIEEGQIIRVIAEAKSLLPALYPGDFDAELFGFARNIHGSITVKKSNQVLIWHNQKSASWFSSLRNTIKSRLGELLLPREAAVVLAQLIGDTRLLASEQKMLYRQVGAGHLLAVSGLQVSMFAFILFVFLRSVLSLCPHIGPRSYFQRAAAILAILLIWFFVALCGAPPSAVRAGLMASTMLAGLYFGRNISSVNALGLAGLFSVLYWPACVVDPSFLLSYAAIIGLVATNSARHYPDDLLTENTTLSPSIKRKKYLWSLIAASICAGLMTIPLSAFLFGELAWSGLFTNIIIVPIASFLQVPALLGALIGIFFHCQWVAQLAAALLGVIEALCEGLALITFGVAPVDSPSGLVVLLLTALSLSAIVLMAHRRYLLVLAHIFIVLLFIITPHFLSPTGLKISILPVGQGDSTVFQFPSGHTMIVDAGGQNHGKFNPGETIVTPFLQREGIKHLDVMVVSHPDPDHILGLFPVLKNFSVSELWISGYADRHPLMKQLVALAQKKGAKVKIARELLGRHSFGESIVEVLAPHPHNGDEIYSELSHNDNSLVLKISYGRHSALWPGDIEEWGEKYLLADHQMLKADIVKAPHHGSKTSSTTNFVTSTSPQHVIFCVGPNNRWNFPHQPVLQRWLDSGAIPWDTSEHGQITIWMADSKITVKPFRTVRTGVGIFSHVGLVTTNN